MSNSLSFDRRLHIAYELGRLRMAARVAPAIAVLAMAAVLELGWRPWVWVATIAILTASVGLRWHSRAGVEDVTVGIQAGVLPLIVGLTLCHVGCPTFSPFSVYGAMCVGLGAVSGAWIARGEIARASFSARRWGAATIVATLVAGLGCATLGIGNVLGIGLGIAGAAGTLVTLRQRAWS